MKSITRNAAFLLGMLVPLYSFAHAPKIESVAKSVPLVLKQLSLEEPEEVSSLFSGVKGWVDGHDIFVKVYLTGRSELLYSCMWDHSTDPEKLKCNKK